MTDTIHIISENNGTATIGQDVDCESYNVCFSIDGVGDVTDVHWTIVDKDGNENYFDSENPCFDFEQSGKYTVSVEFKTAECDGVLYIEKEIDVLELLDLNVESDDITYCTNSSVVLTATLNTDDQIIWQLEDGTQIGVGRVLNIHLPEI
ncbi:MAG: hypothetical protein R2771_10655 [Saprospiraceae bacterium]